MYTVRFVLQNVRITSKMFVIFTLFCMFCFFLFCSMFLKIELIFFGVCLRSSAVVLPNLLSCFLYSLFFGVCSAILLFCPISKFFCYGFDVLFFFFYYLLTCFYCKFVPKFVVPIFFGVFFLVCSFVSGWHTF